MRSKDNFDMFVSAFMNGNKNASKVFLEHISVIMDQWGRKNKIELCWNAKDSQIVPVKTLCEKVHHTIFHTLQSHPENITSFSTYKKIVISTVEKFIANGFKEFNRLLIEGENISWKLVDSKLKCFSSRWFYERKSFLKGNEVEVYNSSLAVLYEKISSLQKYFNNSYGLKSYFFCILENKARENNRKKLTFIPVHQNIPETMPHGDQQEEPEGRVVKIRNSIKRLSDIEQYIILHHFWNGKKLNELAEELHISFENCRVIKHRAIKKIVGYMNINK